MRFGDDFLEFMGYRESLIEDKVEECLDAARRGETSVTIDAGDLTDDETRRVQQEVTRRLEKGRC